MGRVTSSRRITRIVEDRRVARPDTLVVEEPLEIRVGGSPVSVTMRTPGDDFDLVAGFLVTEGAVRAPAHLRALRYCMGAEERQGSSEDGYGDTYGDSYNVIDAALGEGAAAVSPRAFYTTSSCGICGKASIDAVRADVPGDISSDGVVLDADLVARLPDRLRRAQTVFDRTGGLHAAGVFAADGRLVCLREDVGRHNAVDKVVGWALRAGRLPLSGHVLQVSGRASFELTQKALMAGMPVLSAVSAPSSLAVDLAREAGMTLVGFVRGRSMNVYAGEWRIR